MEKTIKNLNTIIDKAYKCVNNDYSLLEKKLFQQNLHLSEKYKNRYNEIVSKNKIVSLNTVENFPSQILPPNIKISPAIIIPVWVNDEIKTLIFNGTETAKNIKPEIFNLNKMIRPGKNLFIVDEVFDCLSLEIMGYNAIAINKMTNRVLDLIIKNIKVLKNTKFILHGSSIAKKNNFLDIGLKVDLLKIPIEYKNINDFYLKDFNILKDTIDNLVNYKFEDSYIMNQFLHNIAENRTTKVLSTGIKQLDQKLNGGIYPGLYTLGAITSLGKTALALQIADHVSKENPVLFFSLEMPKDELISRSLSRELVKKYGIDDYQDVSTLRVLNGQMDFYKKEFENILKSYVDVQGKNLKIISGNFKYTIDDILQEVEKFIDNTGKKPVIFIDYLQVIRASKGDKYCTEKERIDNMVVELKRLSAFYKIPVFVVSSFNRQNYSQIVSFESFKESGGIEYTADFVLGIELKILKDIVKQNINPEIKKDKLDKEKGSDVKELRIKILKNRNGKTGTEILLNFYGRNNLFAIAGNKSYDDKDENYKKIQKQKEIEKAKKFIDDDMKINKLVNEILPDFRKFSEFSGVGSTRKLKRQKLQRYFNEKNKQMDIILLDQDLIIDKLINLIKSGKKDATI